MTSGRKLNGENSKSEMRDMISYFEKSTGVFNGDGFISQQELKAIKNGMFKKEVVEYFDNYKIEPKNITLIRELEEDYKRRQGNIVLRAVKNIKPEIYERKRRYKVNDNGLKRRLAISRYKVGKLIDGFLSTFGEESEYLSRDYTNRLKEIEDEIQEEREREKSKEQEKINSSWSFEKG